MSNNTRGALLALLAFGIFATHDVVVKTLGASYSAFQIVFFSVLMGFPFITMMLISDRTEGNLRPRHPWWTLARTGAAVVTGVSAFYAFSNLPLAQVYAILFATPLLITVLAIPMLGERVRLRRWAAVIVGLVGVLIVLRPGQDAFELGHLAALTAACGSALTSIIVRKIGSEERSVVLILYPMLANCLIMAAILPFVYQPMPMIHFAGFAVIAVCAFVAMLLTIFAYRLAEAGTVAPMQYSQIIWAAGYGYFFFDETPDLYTWLGAAVIIGSGLYILFRESRTPASEHRPVLQTQGRPETGTSPRISLVRRLAGARQTGE